MSIPGYNYNESLLPAAHGVITAMRGGRFTEYKGGDEFENKASVMYKHITILGISYIIEKPTDENNLTSNHNKIIEVLGLTQLESNEKYKIIKALYDNECNLDKPLIMISGCEPVRKIIDSVGLYLLTNISVPRVKSGGSNWNKAIEPTEKRSEPTEKLKKAEKGTVKYSTRKKPKKYCKVKFVLKS